MDGWLRRTLDALENIAAELERLRVLREHELGVRVEQDEHGPYVRVGEE
jgi:hypothetical protein